MAYQWTEITQDFDRSIPFTKVRWDISDDIGAYWAVVNGYGPNGFFSESPNINCDGINWRDVSGSTYGYAGQNRFTLRIPNVSQNGRVFSCRAQGFTDRSMTTYGTQIDSHTYEYTYPVTLYWGGIGLPTNPYSSPYGTGIYVYVDVASVLVVSPTSLTSDYNATAFTVSLTAGDNTTWSATTVPSWITVSPLTGDSSTTLTVTFAKNTSFSGRTSTIVFTDSNNSTCEIVCTQGAYPLLIPNNNIYRGGLIIN